MIDAIFILTSVIISCNLFMKVNKARCFLSVITPNVLCKHLHIPV